MAINIFCIFTKLDKKERKILQKFDVFCFFKHLIKHAKENIHSAEITFNLV